MRSDHVGVDVGPSLWRQPFFTSWVQNTFARSHNACRGLIRLRRTNTAVVESVRGQSHEDKVARSTERAAKDGESPNVSGYGASHAAGTAQEGACE
jgi:hypothetical protein